MVAYLKKILKTGNRRGNEINGSDGTTPRKSTGSIPDLLLGVDVSKFNERVWAEVTPIMPYKLSLYVSSKQSTKKERINDKLAEIFAKIGSKENTREVSWSRISYRVDTRFLEETVA